MTERFLPRSKEELKQAVANYCGVKHDRSHGPIGTWDTSLITDMSKLFYNLRKFNDESIADWDTSSVTDMGYMFYGCTSFNQPLSAWNIASVMYMDYMFEGCTSFYQPMGSWHKPRRLFQNCPDPDYCCTVCSDEFGCK